MRSGPRRVRIHIVSIAKAKYCLSCCVQYAVHTMFEVCFTIHYEVLNMHHVEYSMHYRISTVVHALCTLLFKMQSMHCAACQYSAHVAPCLME